MDYGGTGIGDMMSPNPKGMSVHSQGRQPLEEDRSNRLNAEGVVVRLPPFQGYSPHTHRFQGLTPLAIYYQPLRGLSDLVPRVPLGKRDLLLIARRSDSRVG